MTDTTYTKEEIAAGNNEIFEKIKQKHGLKKNHELVAYLQIDSTNIYQNRGGHRKMGATMLMRCYIALAEWKMQNFANECLKNMTASKALKHMWKNKPDELLQYLVKTAKYDKL